MHLLLQISFGHRGSTIPVALDCDDSTSVGEVADLIVERLSLEVAGRPTVAVAGRSHRALARVEPMSEVGIRSGDVIAVRPEDEGTARRVASDLLATSPAVLVVHATNSTVERRYPLRLGANLVGRDPSAAVKIDEAGVSRRHASIVIRDVIEVDDMGSSQGVWVGGQRVRQPVRVEPRSPWSLGEIVVHVERSSSRGDGADTRDHLPFNPPPRVASPFARRAYEVPAPPNKPNKSPLPLSVVLLPVVLIIVMLVSGESLGVLGVAFLIMSPFMMLGTVAEDRIHTRREYQIALEEHKEDVDEVLDRLVQAQRDEVERRRAEAPTTEECDVIVRTRTGRLWERRPGHEDELELNVGSGRLLSRCTLTIENGGPRRAAKLLRDLPRQYARVASVPATVSLLGAGSIGVAGSDLSADVARALVLQAVALHSPADLSVGAIVGPASVRTWEWLKWLPHASARGFPVDVHPLAGSPDAAVSLIEAIDTLISDVPKGEQPVIGKRVLLVIDDADLPVDRSRLMHLLAAGPAHGIHALWVSRDFDRLPSTAGASILVDPSGTASLGFSATGEVLRDIEVERASIEQATGVSVALSPVVDISRSTAQDEEPPDRITLPAALDDIALLDRPERITERWLDSLNDPLGLAATIGHRGRSPMAVDIRRDGPHALIAGTTGAGKSELLQSLLAALAVTHSPSRLTFLLVDYKGGAAFKDCKLLPHTVGFVTDLDHHEVQRALVSLNAELTYRERLLNEYDAKDLIEMEERGIAAAPPSLMIVIDEFAALAKEVPEFVDGVVNVAQRGRSLGLHLILATQRPAGVITDNIRANTNLRIALRVSDAEDSVDVIGVPTAANLSRSLPGRAIAKVGPSEILPFQSAYVGGFTDPGSLASRLEVTAFHFTGSGPLLPDNGADQTMSATRMHAMQNATLPPEAFHGTAVDLAGLSADSLPADDGSAGPAEPGSDLSRIVLTTNAAFAALRVPQPRKPWLDPLPALIDLLSPDGWSGIGRAIDAGQVLIGRLDDPSRQAQHDAILNLNTEGSMLVFGTSRSGKSALLRTIAVSVGRNASTEPVHVYGVDFTGRGLASLEMLPHVGSVIAGEDEERVARLVRYLREVQRERAVLFREANNAADLAEYRRAVPNADLARIVVLIDGYPALNQLYELDLDDLPEQFNRLIAEGRSAGIHFVLAADMRGGVPTKVYGGISTRVVLRMATEEEYSNVDLPFGVLSPDVPAGRGYLNDDEIQVALVGSGTSGEAQVESLQRVAEELSYLPEAPPIARLETKLALSTLARATAAGTAVIGRSGVTLEPVSVNLVEQHTVILGPAGSGRTSALLALAMGCPDGTWSERIVLSPRASFLTGAPDTWTAVAEGLGACSEALSGLIDRVEAIAEGDAEPLGPTLVVIDDVFEMTGDFTVEENLRNVLALTRDHPIRIAVACDLDHAGRTSVDFFHEIRSARHGVLLHPEYGDGEYLGAQFRIPNVAAQPPGRGYLIVRGQPELVQLADPLA